jgi:hypothetical protein
MAQERGHGTDTTTRRGRIGLPEQAGRFDAPAGVARELTEAQLTHLVGGSGDPIEGGPDEALKASPKLM